ncbi:membrane protein [Amycolatopsis sp. MJM2582]|uniref:DUF3817 domain-containing protein n=4 Tax=Amycolatopsis TaxID=1813 RepID=M2PFD2_9PSEU|nr:MULTISPECIES: DUF3817 domain-containing protein [Amycolatopsis]AIG78163.1 Conserved putative membrane protein [Amycolatopsis japonica]EMD23068.1 hypothetical protein C791_7738 [Amycolatopsis azurea DSM 43854]EME54158.1 hypothetical protein H074_29463 [Amycolatopsis decaplanina DSM 44594]KFZ79487.1 membrane protein [Amycolatopsis sp. MJM2582]OKJ95931.1 hypothetical protein AMK34_23395 [Amycolatopsis sp. CB00013]
MTTRTDDAAPARPVSLGGPLIRFRVAAYATGVALLGLVVEMLLQYVFRVELPQFVKMIPMVHGGLYLIYLLLAVDLAIKARWSMKGTLLVLIAGCIPFFSFVMERKVTHKVQAGAKL